MEFKPVVFRVGNEEYGVDIIIVRGIEKVIPIVPIPNSNNVIKGIINLRGAIVPICSLRRKFGKPDMEYTEDTKFIIVKSDDLLLGLEVDSVGEIQNIDEDNIFDVPRILISEGTRYYSKIINIDGCLIVMLDVNKIFKAEEIKELEKTVSELQKS